MLQRKRRGAVSEFAFASGAANPRKRPLQARSKGTVDAILTATLRVLDEGGEALTTTRVAEVAGVSVGTLYQYFPNREALITGVLADHLEVAIGAAEAAAADAGDTDLCVAVDRVVRAFLRAKHERVAVAVLLHRVVGVGKLDERPVVRAGTLRARQAMARLLPDVPPATALARAGVACAAIEGMVSSALVEDLNRFGDPAWVDQVVAITIAAMSPAVVTPAARGHAAGGGT